MLFDVVFWLFLWVSSGLAILFLGDYIYGEKPDIAGIALASILGPIMLPILLICLYTDRSQGF